jgi:hypothetical protein
MQNKILNRRFVSLPVLLLVGMTGCGQSPSFNSFVRHDTKYYAEFARECDSLIARTSAPRRVRGDEEGLPTLLRGLHVPWIELDTNRVSISTGEGRGGYGILWGPSSRNPALWELSAGAESYITVLYSENKITGSRGAAGTKEGGTNEELINEPIPNGLVATLHECFR